MLRRAASELTHEENGLSIETEMINIQLLKLAEEAQLVSDETQTLSNAQNLLNQSVQTINIQAQEATIASERATAHTTEALRQLLSLAKAEDEIAETIKSIQSIAHQTHLLSLNASIEAAAAGDHGRGFAVVAQEVKQLSQEVTIAAKRIVARDKEMNALIQELEQAIRAVEKISVEIDASNREIATLMNSQERRAAEVNAGTQRAASALKQVQGEVGGAAQQALSVSEKTIQVSSQVVDEAEELYQAAQTLNSLLESFKL